MRIAVLNEISAVDKNKDIMDALAGRGHELFNLGMADAKDTPQLLYIHTGFLAAFLLALGKVDLVIGGCGTGQGFLNAVMQYPGASSAATSSRPWTHGFSPRSTMATVCPWL